MQDLVSKGHPEHEDEAIKWEPHIDGGAQPQSASETSLRNSNDRP